MKALIIGGAGFVGGYLTDHLKDNCQWSVGITKLVHENFNTNDTQVYSLDIMDKNAIKNVLMDFKPDCIFHLAAQSSVALSWKNPKSTIDTNINGTLNLLDTIRELDINPKILLIGSGEEYGYVKSEEIPISEETILRPGNIYAVTKACQNMIGKIYAKAYSMDIVMVRAFNHIGPGQPKGFVIPDFCYQIAAIEKNLQKPLIKVGNLEAKRDFTDVRDVVKAYGLLIEKGVSGEIYNVGSGKAVSIQYILESILSLSKKKIEIIVDENKLRPSDVPLIESNINKIKLDTNWIPSISMNETLFDVLNFWRNQ